jgi:hypothetical protein
LIPATHPFPSPPTHKQQEGEYKTTIINFSKLQFLLFFIEDIPYLPNVCKASVVDMWPLVAVQVGGL